MNAIITEISKYLLLAIMLFFTMETYMVLRRRDEETRRRIMRKQIGLMVLFNIVSYLDMFVMSREIRMLYLLGLVVSYILIVQILYRLIYRKASLILMNTMCMILSVGFVIQARLGIETAFKQFIIATGSTLICFIIPVFIRRVRLMSQLGWIYGVVGIVLLTGVFLFGRVTGGANLNLTIGGISFQFSEFVKITIVMFMAGMLQERNDFRQVVIVTVVAAMHVGILALSADLGAALIYFVAYIVMVFVATRNPGYVLLGLGGMSGASVIAYRLFAHVRTRVQVWKDPFADYEGTGYQIIQALFGVCAGGWFGTGLFNGNPEMIPLAYEDFTFAAICEEFGILFAICLLLLCMGMYLLIVSISMKLEKPFYRLVAIGLGTEYAFQVFLTVGGTTKFIPMTGITLPLVSYGGSSIMCTIIMLSIIQGLYIMRRDESDEIAEEIARLNYEERMARRAALEQNRQNRLGRRRQDDSDPWMYDLKGEQEGSGSVRDNWRRRSSRTGDPENRRTRTGDSEDRRTRTGDPEERRTRTGDPENRGIRTVDGAGSGRQYADGGSGNGRQNADGGSGNGRQNADGGSGNGRQSADDRAGNGRQNTDGRAGKRRARPDDSSPIQDRRNSSGGDTEDRQQGVSSGQTWEDAFMYDLKGELAAGKGRGQAGAEEDGRTQIFRRDEDDELARRIEEEARKGLEVHY